MEKIQSQITFLYYQDIEQAAAFFQEVLGLEPVEDQQWAKIYRLSGNAFLGAVSGEQGFHQVQDQSAVLITLVVDDVPWWYEHLKSHGVKLLSGLQHRVNVQIRCFFFEDPGGYSYEIQQFLKPELVNIFHPDA